jgi:MOSC domain-containing protein YiiM
MVVTHSVLPGGSLAATMRADNLVRREDPRMGQIEGIFITTAAGEPMQALDEAQALGGAGLAGDRYVLGTGFYSDGNTGRQLTLIAAEALETLAREHGVTLTPLECRRNVVTRGIELNGLVGQRFQIGEIACEGIRLCPPCNHLEELTRPGMLRGLARSGGLRAQVLNDGVMRVGDAIASAAD